VRILNIDTLVQPAQAGNEQATLLLFDAFAGLMKKAAAQSHLQCIYEDALSEARMSFMEAIRSYDSSMGVPFAGYARAKVYGNLRTLFKQQRRKWQRETSADIGDETTGTRLDCLADSRANYEDSLLNQLILHPAFTKLSEKQRYVLTLLFDKGKTQSELAKELRISQQSVGKIKKTALSLLKKELSM
jgi:RNA polymerase sigma factor (sigma-70 family)